MSIINCDSCGRDIQDYEVSYHGQQVWCPDCENDFELRKDGEQS